MIDGNVYDFLDKLYYEDHYVIYNNEKYFFNGCQSRISPDGKVMSVRLEIYNLSTKPCSRSLKRPQVNVSKRLKMRLSGTENRFGISKNS